jgi:ketosteroid isomerase-like protein
MTLGLFVVAVLAAPAPGGTPFEHVVAAERAFAADAIREGHHAAFVTAFAEDGVVFDPTPTNARAKHAGKPRASGTLFWDPAWAVVSSSGDLGFTSGPWQYKEPGDGTSPPATGWFFTAWRKQPDGSFKVEADLGVSAPLNYAAPGDVVDASPASTGAPAPRPSSAANARVAIVHAERLLARAAASGLGAAVLAVAEPSVRVADRGYPTSRLRVRARRRVGVRRSRLRLRHLHVVEKRQEIRLSARVAPTSGWELERFGRRHTVALR